MKKPISSILLLGAILSMITNAGAVSITSALLQYNVHPPGGDPFETHASVAGGGAPVSVGASDLAIPGSIIAPSGEVDVAIGSIRFGGDSPDPTSTENGGNRLSFSGSFLDVLTIPVGPGASGSISINSRLDGNFSPDSRFAGIGSAPSAWVQGSLRFGVDGSSFIGITGDPFAWDFSAVPFGETDTLSPGAEQLLADESHVVDSGVRSVTYHYSNPTGFSGLFHLVLEGGFNAYVRGDGSLDFMSTFSTDVFLSENAPFTTESGITSYVHAPARVPDAGVPFGLHVVAAGALMLSRRKHAIGGV